MGKLWSGMKSFSQRVSNNYYQQLNTLYGDDLTIADTAGLWGATSLALTLTVSSIQSLTDNLATEQISKAWLKGALTEGNILLKMNAAQVGERTAIRTGALLTGMRLTGAGSGVITALGTGYSVGARGNALVRALLNSF